MNSNTIKITARDDGANIVVNGVDVSDHVYSYRVEQSAGGRCRVEINYRYYPTEFEIEVTE